MADPAGLATALPTTATGAAVREASGGAAGTYPIDVGEETVTGWHTHDRHQLEYAFEGVAQVETGTARYLLPPQQAVWIPAGVGHCTTLRNVRAIGVYFHPDMNLPAGDRVRVLAVPPVLREMVLYASRWPIGRPAADPLCEPFFEVMGKLIITCLQHEVPLFLPTSDNQLVSSAMDYTAEHLADVTMARLCAAMGTSERSLRRAFVAGAGMSWRSYLTGSRILKAMTLLTNGQYSLLAISLAVGFQNESAFIRAFKGYTGETPGAYRKRIEGSGAAGRITETWPADLAHRAAREWTREAPAHSHRGPAPERPGP